MYSVIFTNVIFVVILCSKYPKKKIIFLYLNVLYVKFVYPMKVNYLLLRTNVQLQTN